MNRSLRIVVADDEPNMYEYFQEVLPQLGHEVVAVAHTGRELVEQCHTFSPDLVITDIKMPDMDGLEAAAQVFQDGPIPVILVTAYHEPDLIERAEACHVQAYLVKPIKQADLLPAIAIAMRRFAELLALRKEAGDLRQALEDRKVIERAKGVLMRRGHLDEQEAFKRLQDLASNENRKMVEIARMIVTTEKALNVPGKS